MEVEDKTSYFHAMVNHISFCHINELANHLDHVLTDGLGCMVQNWPSTLKKWLNRFCKNEYRRCFFLDNLANFQLKLMILAQETFSDFVKFDKFGPSSKTLEGTLTMANRFVTHLDHGYIEKFVNHLYNRRQMSRPHIQMNSSLTISLISIYKFCILHQNQIIHISLKKNSCIEHTVDRLSP